MANHRLSYSLQFRSRESTSVLQRLITGLNTLLTILTIFIVGQQCEICRRAQRLRGGARRMCVHVCRAAEYMKHSWPVKFPYGPVRYLPTVDSIPKYRNRASPAYNTRIRRVRHLQSLPPIPLKTCKAVSATRSARAWQPRCPALLLAGS